MNTLALDTATEILSVALSTGDSLLLETRDTGLRHSRLLMPLVSRILADAGLEPADLDLIACTRGPGSFTGLRIGMSTAKGLAAALSAARDPDQPAPLVSISTLAVMARNAIPPHLTPAPIVLPVIDGRKKRFYGAAFRAGERLTGDLDLSPDEMLAKVKAECTNGTQQQPDTTPVVLVTGPHVREFTVALRSNGQPAAVTVDELTVIPDFAPHPGYAVTLVRLAEEQFAAAGADSPDQGPVYVRDSDAELSRKPTFPS